MTTIDHSRNLQSSSVPLSIAEAGEAPSCPTCRTDEYLIFEEYVPARRADSSGHLLPAGASYTCSECGTFTAHAVPASWRPPRWFWYS